MAAKEKRTNKGEKSAHTISKGRTFNFRPALFCAIAMICGILFAVAALEEGKGKACLFFAIFLALAAVCCIVRSESGKEGCNRAENGAKVGEPSSEENALLKENDALPNEENVRRTQNNVRCVGEHGAEENGEDCGNIGVEEGTETTAVSAAGDEATAIGAVGVARKRKIVFSSIRALLLCLFFAFGACSFAVRRADYKNASVYGEAECVARVTERRDYGYYVLLTFDRLSFDGRSADGKMRAFARKDGEFANVGENDVVTFLADVKTKTAWMETEENETRRRTYEWLRDIRYDAENLELVSVRKGEVSVFARVRTRLKETLYSSMDEDAAAIAFALLTGDSAEMNGELLNNFRYGGVAHLFAVSGLHVGALFAFLAAMFKRVRSGKLPGIVKWAVVCAMLCFYGGVCGYSASVVRAIAACLIGYADALIAVKRDSVEALAKAAVFVLILSPLYLFDVGFLLSFAAAGGILCLTPTLKRAAYTVFFGDERGIRREKGAVAACAEASETDRTGEEASRFDGCAERAEARERKKGLGKGGKAKNGKRGDKKSGAAMKRLIDFFAVTIAATLATLPILARAFGYASMISLFLNVLIVPMVSAVFSPFLILAFFSAAFPWVGAVALYIPSVLFSLLSTMFYAADYSAVLVGVPFTSVSMIAYYVALIFASDKLNVPTRVKISAVAAGICVVVGGFFA